ncbi:MAG TPA: transglutaminase domain-containing protein [Candidatus Dormibacteraeota bacterium]
MRPAHPRRGGVPFVIASALCLGLMAAMSWDVLATGWVGGGGAVLTVVGLASVAEAVVLARAHVSRFVFGVALPVLALATIVPLTASGMPAAPGQRPGTFIAHYLSAALTGVTSTQAWTFEVGLGTALFVCGSWLAWLAVREHRGVLAVMPIFVVLAIDVVNASTPESMVLPEGLCVGLALAVIAAAHRESLGAGWVAGRITPLGKLGWRFGGGACLVAVGLTVTALILPPASSADFTAWLSSFGRNGVQHGLGASGGAETIGFASTVNLGGALVSHPKPVLTYTTDEGASAYLSVVADTDFDRGNWYLSATGSSPGGYTWTGLQYAGDQLPRDTNPADGGIGKDEQTVRAHIVMTASDTGPEQFALFTGEPEGVNLPGVAFGVVNTASPFALLTVDSVQFIADAGAEASTLQTTSLVSTATATQLSAAGTDYPAWTQQYIELNDDSTRGAEAIRSLAQAWTSGLVDPYSQAMAIEAHLRDPTLFHYTLDPPADPGNRVWPLVYFLTVSHRGYCQYFASAMGAMLRSLGIPTRLMSGYGPGTAQDLIKPIPGVNQQVVTTSDAHTWVEAYFPGYGWIPFEPTPPSAQGDYQPFARGAAAITQQVPPPPLATPSPGIRPGIRKPVTDQGSPTDTTTSGVATELIVVTVLGILFAVIVAVLLWFLLPRSVSGAWRRLETLGAISGVDRRTSETHQAFAARLGRARPRASTALSGFATLAARDAFSAAGASANERAIALRAWRRALCFMSVPR